MPRNIKTERAGGFSLVELMIALGIVAALASGTASLFSTWVTYKQNINASSVADQTQLVVSSLLANQCTANLGPLGAKVVIDPKLNLTQPFKDSIGAEIVKVGETIQSGTKLASWKIVQIADLGPIGTDKKILADLLLTFENSTANGAINLISKKIKLSAVVDSSAKLLSCELLIDGRLPASSTPANNGGQKLAGKFFTFAANDKVLCEYKYPMAVTDGFLSNFTLVLNGLVGSSKDQNFGSGYGMGGSYPLYFSRPRNCSGSGVTDTGQAVLVAPDCSLYGAVSSGAANGDASCPEVVCISNGSTLQPCTETF